MSRVDKGILGLSSGWMEGSWVVSWAVGGVSASSDENRC